MSEGVQVKAVANGSSVLSEGGSCALTTNTPYRKLCGKGSWMAGPSKEAGDLNLRVMSPDPKGC